MWLQSLLLCLPLALAVSGPREPEAPEDAGELHCGPRGLRLTVHPLNPDMGPSPTLIAWGKSDDAPAELGSGSLPRPPKTSFQLPILTLSPLANSTASLQTCHLSPHS